MTVCQTQCVLTSGLSVLSGFPTLRAEWLHLEGWSQPGTYKFRWNGIQV